MRAGTGTGIRTPVPWLRNAAGDLDGLRLRRFSSGFRTDLRVVWVGNNPFSAQSFKNLSSDLEEYAFQACSIDHSDISPSKTNDLRVVRHSGAQNPPSNPDVPRCDLDSAVYRRA